MQGRRGGWNPALACFPSVGMTVGMVSEDDSCPQTRLLLKVLGGQSVTYQ